MAAERLQKILAAAGISSRRGAEEYIVAGRVRINGTLVRELGIKANPKRDRIEVDGQAIEREQLVYIVLNKPKEVMSTLKDPQGRPTVAELVRIPGARVKPVGRLDYHTSGVLLLTNDGEFAAKLQHPRYGVAKRYSVKLQGEMDERTLAQWRESIMIDGRATLPAEVTRVRTEEKTWLNIVLKEGRNRHIRQLAEHAGSRIMRLVRFEYAGIDAEGLRAGQWRHLTLEELKALKAAHGVPARVTAPHADAEIPGTVHSVPFRNRTKRASDKDEDARESGRESFRAGGREAPRGARPAGRAGARSVDREDTRAPRSGGREAPRGARPAGRAGARSVDREDTRAPRSGGREAPRGARPAGRARSVDREDTRAPRGGGREAPRTATRTGGKAGARTRPLEAPRSGGREAPRGARPAGRAGARSVEDTRAPRSGGREAPRGARPAGRTGARSVDREDTRAPRSGGREAPRGARPAGKTGARSVDREDTRARSGGREAPRTATRPGDKRRASESGDEPRPARKEMSRAEAREVVRRGRG